jgi:ribonuclease HI
MKKKNKYYVVLNGHKKGIFKTWDECKASVDGFAGAIYKSFESEAEAQKVWREGVLPPPQKTVSNPTAPQLDIDNTAPNLITPSVVVDAACAGVPGVMEYRGIILPEHEKIFERGPFPNGTNNIGEFLAIVLALAWLKQRQLDWPVYSDSETALSWIRARKCRTKHTEDRSNKAIFDQIRSAENWLNANPIHNKVLKWPTERWGENPADFGRK